MFLPLIRLAAVAVASEVRTIVMQMTSVAPHIELSFLLSKDMISELLKVDEQM
jgi:hypothetical protein